MSRSKKDECRWHDVYMDCCRHPKTYEWMREESKKRGHVIFAEYSCRCRKGCGFEKMDADHPAWDAEDNPVA